MTYQPRPAAFGGIDRHSAYGIQDRHGFTHAAAEPALDAFAEATDGLLAYRRSTAPALDRALALDPTMAAGHALRGFALVLAGRADTLPAARDCLAAALPRTDDEAALVAALDRALATGPLAAAAVLEARLTQRPGLALLVKLATMLRFLGGDCPGMLATTAAVMPAWNADMPGYGYILGCHAFALEESGAFPEAEAAGRAAIALQPEDPWAVHAVAHVLEMTHRTAEGIAWIEACRTGWDGCNNFAYHLAWHLALFHLDQGDAPRVLDLYDRQIRPDASEDNRDFANAASLLWRLRQHGVPVGYRWNELADIARRRRRETTHIFTALHRLFPLLATGDRPAARDLVAALTATAATSGEQPTVAATIGAPLARALLETIADGDAPPADLARLAHALPPLGGSHAQRDVFLRSLLRLAADRRDLAAVDRLLTLRRRLHADDRFAHALPTA